MDDLVTVEVVQTEMEAEMLCSLLRTAGITCMYRLTNTGAAAFAKSMASGGPQEILVRGEELVAARGVLDARVPLD
jgi:hypothetical protein